MMSSTEFSGDFKRDAVAQIAERGYPCATINGNQHRAESFLRGRSGQQACYTSPAQFAVLMSDGTACVVHFHNYLDDSAEMDQAHFPHKMNQPFKAVN
jgi:hypothetical protein